MLLKPNASEKLPKDIVKWNCVIPGDSARLLRDSGAVQTYG